MASILAGIKAHRATLDLQPPTDEAPSGTVVGEAEAAVEEIAAEAAPEPEPGEPVVEPEPETDAPAVEAQPEGEEPTVEAPPDEPAPASEVTEGDLEHAYKLAGGRTVEALASTLKRFNTNAAEHGRARKEAEAKNARLEKELEELRKSQPATPASAPAAAPATSAAPAPATVPPTPSVTEAQEKEFTERVESLMRADTQAVSHWNSHLENQSRLSEIYSRDPKTGSESGELIEAVQKLAGLASRLPGDHPGSATKLRLVPAPEFEHEGIKAEIEATKRVVRELQREHRLLSSASSTSIDFLDRRQAKYQGEVRQSLDAKSHESAESVRLATERDEFTASHLREFESLVKELKLDGPENKALMARAWNNGLAELITSNEARMEAKADMRAFHKRVIEGEQAWLAQSNKAAAKDTARRVQATVRREAPVGARAVAAPAAKTGQNTDWQKNLRDRAKQLGRGARA